NHSATFSQPATSFNNFCSILSIVTAGENDLVSRFFSQRMEGEKDSSSRRQNN
ncbi:hypothetical protein L9F63_013852, partial [Diploptera punctata]